MANKGKKMRLDALLVARGLADSLEMARALIMAGKVIGDDQRLDKPALSIPPGVAVRVKGDSKFVSRAGEKLDLALEDLQLKKAIHGKVVLDIGASTGGFSQCCLDCGAKHVIALDVGKAQLAWELRQDPRITCLEQTDIRDFDPGAFPAIDWVVADISFNSLARLAPAIRLAAPGVDVGFLLLIKPQFELPRADVPSGGVVLDEALRQKAVTAVCKAMAAVGLGDGITVDAKVAGKSGNREIFYYVRSQSAPKLSE